MSKLIEQLREKKNLTDGQLKELIETDVYDKELFASAVDIREKAYGKDVYIRGLIEISSYCKNDCYYCGIRKSNDKAQRYRLSREEILECCVTGYDLGFRTFVLQGGEDPYFTDERICGIISEIKEKFPGCAVTLSLGEKSRESYQQYFDAGADRYLLRHETAGADHYKKLHPEDLSQEHRMQCLQDLKEIGYQVGSGFMVGSPYQKTEDLISDLRFLQELQPDMIGIGPFITHQDTPFREFTSGELTLCLRMVAILRHLFPEVLLPATTALGTIHPNGRELGLLAGANVVMPNLSPVGVREKYSLYDNKICTGEEAAECRGCLENRVASAGFQIVVDRGDRKNFK
ncbi:MAG: [FeFe] hydrogenase H-cluster radical SAM maturase HydE [Lentihominibacter sp.]|uniref:[FeFe] hydrogenase H-cluster radical SAM maturase HydE n=1 Tax=Lentihominibacter sp. TaxID=2944216 RepID=UPI002A91239E|nr:[FeFe] hydrogenase H-cluster radical SAM maturase HydE [Lentihominibacter sp.]MDY5286402.1 [FeFe] hydrogenase H-cluster radical SAM maturase HydE [Lentihominibacter sp.]